MPQYDKSWNKGVILSELWWWNCLKLFLKITFSDVNHSSYFIFHCFYLSEKDYTPANKFSKRDCYANSVRCWWTGYATSCRNFTKLEINCITGGYSLTTLSSRFFASFFFFDLFKLRCWRACFQLSAWRPSGIRV